jgi:hypothetical protein
MLYEDEKAQFIKDTGLSAEPPLSYSPEGILKILENHGPIWVTTQEDPESPFSLHAQILYGWYGDETVEGTILRIIDPRIGNTSEENFERFMKKYEEVGRLEGVPLVIQTLYY